MTRPKEFAHFYGYRKSYEDMMVFAAQQHFDENVEHGLRTVLT